MRDQRSRSTASTAPTWRLASQLSDSDASETLEWLESFDAVVDHAGRNRAHYLMLSMLHRAREQRVAVPGLGTTNYINTIRPQSEPPFPGDESIERRIRAYIRWNAAIMVHRAQRPGVEVGGHISTYASAAALYEVGFDHFFRGRDHVGAGDQVYFQGHASPGIYARAFLEGRLDEGRLDRFRQEVSQRGAGHGLPSYPHPRRLPDFWEFPTVSMGLTTLNAIYQARFNRYLLNRGIKDTSDQRVWAFLGDGEMDEPESLGAIGVAAREGLDNLTFVINCNLQRLDGPVRGNGKIIQELEAFFHGAGWNVIKVVWGREWDPLLAVDTENALIDLMNTTPDGDFQTYKAESGAFVREHFFGRDPRTRAMVQDLAKHITAGASYVILSAPTTSANVPTVVHSVNTNRSARMISCASCTTNCIAPLMAVARRRLGAERAVMTTVHAYTSHQHLVDGPSKSFRQGRAGAANLVPASTGAAQATIEAIPELSGRFDGIAIRAPIPVGSLADIVFTTGRPKTVAEVNDVFRQEAESPRYAGILGVSEDPLVSADIIGDPRAAIIDLDLTRVVDGRLVKVMAWYDNEWGFTNQMIREVRAILGLSRRRSGCSAVARQSVC